MWERLNVQLLGASIHPFPPRSSLTVPCPKLPTNYPQHHTRRFVVMWERYAVLKRLIAILVSCTHENFSISEQYVRKVDIYWRMFLYKTQINVIILQNIWPKVRQYCFKFNKRPILGSMKWVLWCHNQSNEKPIGFKIVLITKGLYEININLYRPETRVIFYNIMY